MPQNHRIADPKKRRWDIGFQLRWRYRVLGDLGILQYRGDFICYVLVVGNPKGRRKWYIIARWAYCKLGIISWFDRRMRCGHDQGLCIGCNFSIYLVDMLVIVWLWIIHMGGGCHFLNEQRTRGQQPPMTILSNFVGCVSKLDVYIAEESVHGKLMSGQKNDEWKFRTMT